MSFKRSDVGRTYRERLLSRITVDLDSPRPVDDAPCWTWTGKVHKSGYGGYRDQLAHKLVYTELIGLLLDLDHLCRKQTARQRICLTCTRESSAKARERRKASG